MKKLNFFDKQKQPLGGQLFACLVEGPSPFVMLVHKIKEKKRKEKKRKEKKFKKRKEKGEGKNNFTKLLTCSPLLPLTPLGVVKALIQHDLLPRVISGTSGGAIVAGYMAIFTSLLGREEGRRKGIS